MPSTSVSKIAPNLHRTSREGLLKALDLTQIGATSIHFKSNHSLQKLAAKNPAEAGFFHLDQLYAIFFTIWLTRPGLRL